MLRRCRLFASRASSHPRFDTINTFFKLLSSFVISYLLSLNIFLLTKTILSWVYTALAQVEIFKGKQSIQSIFQSL